MLTPPSALYLIYVASHLSTHPLYSSLCSKLNTAAMLVQHLGFLWMSTRGILVLKHTVRNIHSTHNTVGNGGQEHLSLHLLSLPLYQRSLSLTPPSFPVAKVFPSTPFAPALLSSPSFFFSCLFLLSSFCLLFAHLFSSPLIPHLCLYFVSSSLLLCYLHLFSFS